MEHPENSYLIGSANLLSELMTDVCDLMGIKTTAYHPKMDGLVEKFNRTLKAMIAKHAKTFGPDWDVYLPQLLFACRTKPLESHHFTSSMGEMPGCQQKQPSPNHCPHTMLT